jgi:hypothetical protein
MAFATAVLTILLHWARTPRAPRTANPHCPVCRYPVRGATTPVCSECGADFREVGIVSPPTRSPASAALGKAVAVVGWTIVLAVLANSLIVALGSTIGPRIRNIQAQYEYVADPFGEPSVRSAHRIEVHRRDVIWPGRTWSVPTQPPADRVVWSERDTTMPRSVIFFPQEDLGEIHNSDGTTARFLGPPSAEMLREYLEAKERPGADPNVASFEDELARLFSAYAEGLAHDPSMLDAVKTAPLDGAHSLRVSSGWIAPEIAGWSASSRFVTEVDPHPAVTVVGGIIAAVVYLYGLSRILHRRPDPA